MIAGIEALPTSLRPNCAARFKEKCGLAPFS
jgi:hypothetical protein